MQETKTIYATGGHRWLVDSRLTATRPRHLKEVVTSDLKAGDFLAMETGDAYCGTPDPEGIGAGIVFGDGTALDASCRVALYGEKADLADGILDFGVEVAGDKRFPESRVVSRLPLSWKCLPDASEDLDWLAGWLAGYIATDGCVDGRSIRISSSSEINLLRVREVCYRLGIRTHSPRVVMRKGFGEVDSPHFTVSLHPMTVPDSLLIRADQLAKKPAGGRSPARWTVVSVKETDRVEEVYCASVPETRAFVLADNILTGNCDYVAVWFTRMLPTKNFPEPDESANQCGFTQRMIEVKIKLRRPCWPVLRDNPNSPFPPSTEVQAAAEKLTVDANVLWCCLSGGFLRPTDEPECLASRVAEIEPDNPEGGCAGLTATLWIELEGCCSGDAV